MDEILVFNLCVVIWGNWNFRMFDYWCRKGNF